MTGSGLGHIQVNVAGEHLPFYRDLFDAIGWRTIHGDDGMHGVEGTNGASLWFAAGANGHANHYDGAGVNHLGLSVAAIADVDATAAWLTERGVRHLFETPRHRADFSSGENDTYYQVMFESPDRVLFEVVYIGPKDAA